MSWPLHDLVLTTDRLVLRGLDEAAARALAEVVPDDLETDPRLPDVGLTGRARQQARVLQSYWRGNAHWSPADWVLPFGVTRDGVLVGLQALEGQDFAQLRTVDSNSWLVPSARGLGLGREMRAAVLALAFDHLGAQRAVSEAWEDNAASLGVSRSLGYVDNGVDLHPRDGGVGRRQRLQLHVAGWKGPGLRSNAVRVEGLEPCLPLFGL